MIQNKKRRTQLICDRREIPKLPSIDGKEEEILLPYI